MEDLYTAAVNWLREALAWVALALAGGTLFALKTGAVGVRDWLGVLIKSVIVGGIASRVIMDTEWGAGWQWVAVAVIAFGADAIVYLVDWGWRRLASDPAGVARATARWLISKKIVIAAPPPADREGEAKPKEDSGNDRTRS